MNDLSSPFTVPVAARGRRRPRSRAQVQASIPALALILAAGPAISGCVADAGNDVAGEGAVADAAPPGPGDCVPDELRPTRTVTVSGTVQDYATAQPIAGADVVVSTAWDTGTVFAADCPPLATLSASADGQFGPASVEVGSRLASPIAIFMVAGDDRAATASDQRLVCAGADCGEIEQTIAVPSRELAAAWRRELERGGMPNAGTRGLVLFEFRNADGSPAEGVVPWRSFLVATRVLLPDTEVRFLEPDSTTLAPPGTSSTTGSGVAVIGVNADSPSELIGGSRGSEGWPETGVLDPPGWIFVEDRRPSPP